MKSYIRGLGMFKILIVALSALASCWLACAALAGAASSKSLYIPNEYIIRVRAGASYSTVQQNVSKIGGTIVKSLPLSNNTYLIKVGVPQVGNTMKPLAKAKTVSQWVIEYIEPNALCYPCATPNDEYWDRLWGLRTINCPAAWDIEKGDESVVVAVLDTGVAYDHPDLAGRCVQGWDAYDNDNDPYDEGFVEPDNSIAYHGTHVAGTIAAQGNNGIGVCGVCWDGVKIMPVRVIDEEVGAPYDVIIQGLDYALTHGAKVVNMSLGSPARFGGNEACHSKIAQLVNAGVIVVASAGNDDPPTDTNFPAAFPECIAVGATAIDDSMAYYSCFGPSNEVDIAAPGGDLDNPGGAVGGIYSTMISYTGEGDAAVKNFGYVSWQGTSMAAPHVSGAAALLLSAGVPSQGVRTRLTDSARVPTTGYDVKKYGAGILNLSAALTNASVTIASPRKGATVGTNPAFKIKLRGFYQSEPNVYPNIKVYFDYADDGDGIPDNPAEPTIIDSSNLNLYANTALTEINFTWFQLNGTNLAPGKHYIYVEADPPTGGDPVYDWGTFEVMSQSVEAGLYMFALPMSVDTSSVTPGDILTNADFSFTSPTRAVMRRYLTTAGVYASYYPNNPSDLAWVNPMIGSIPSGGATYDLVKINPDTGVIDRTDRRTNQFGFPVGTGFWLILSEPTPISDAYTPLESVNTDNYIFDVEQGCKIRLYRGWNMVGNPYTHQIPLGGALVSYHGVTKSLQDAAAAGWISTVVYGYRTSGTSGYEIIGLGNMLQPYRSYWFRALIGGTDDYSAVNLRLLP